MARIAFLYKKSGNEKEISLSSGEHVYGALIKLGHKAVKIPFSEDINLKKLKSFDMAFNLVYGRYGEDGTLAAMLQALKIPFVSPSVTNCMLTFNKLITKRILSVAGIRTPKQTQKPPLIFKSATGGSSEDVLLIKTGSELSKIEQRVRHSNNYLFEKYLDGREFCATAIRRDGQIVQLPIAEIEKDGAIFSREAKYGGSKKYLEIPARISKTLQSEKVDFILDSEDKLNVIEVDGIPGFGPNSILTQAAISFGIPFEELVRILIDETRRNSKHPRAGI